GPQRPQIEHGKRGFAPRVEAGVLRVGVRVGDDLREAHDLLLIPGVVDDRLIALAGRADVPQGRGVGHAVPDRALLRDKALVRVGVRLGLQQECGHRPPWYGLSARPQRVAVREACAAWPLWRG